MSGNRLVQRIGAETVGQFAIECLYMYFTLLFEVSVQLLLES